MGDGDNIINGRAERIERTEVSRAAFRHDNVKLQSDLRSGKKDIVQIVSEANKKLKENKQDLTYRELNKDAILMSTAATGAIKMAEKISFRKEEFNQRRFEIGLAEFFDKEYENEEVRNFGQLAFSQKFNVALFASQVKADKWVHFGIRVQSAFDRTVYKQHLKLGRFETVKVKAKSALKPKRGSKTDLLSKRKTKIAPITVQLKEEQLMGHRLKSLEEDLVKAFKANKNHPVHYFKFLIDPESFELSVRNIFHMSFLVKKFKAVLVFDAQSQPHVYPKSFENKLKNKPGSRLDVDRKMDQVKNWIVSINKEDWKQIIGMYNITKSTISDPS